MAVKGIGIVSYSNASFASAYARNNFNVVVETFRSLVPVPGRVVYLCKLRWDSQGTPCLLHFVPVPHIVSVRGLTLLLLLFFVQP